VPAALSSADRQDRGRKEKTYDLRYGVEPIRLAGRPEQLYLVVVAGFGEEPLLLLTNALDGARDSQSLWWIARIYLTRWKIEETFRFIKQSYNLEDIRVMKYQRLKNLVVLVTAAAYFAATFLGQKMKLRILCEKLLIISQRFSAFHRSDSTRWPMESRTSSPKAAQAHRKSRFPIYNWNCCLLGTGSKSEETPT